jgi:hypothetical protein
MTEEEVRADLAGYLESDVWCKHEYLFSINDVDHVITYKWSSDEGYAQYDLLAIVRLKDGTFGMLTSWADTSGHGCRCDVMTVIESSLSRLLGHLTDYELAELLDIKSKVDVDW